MCYPVFNGPDNMFSACRVERKEERKMSAPNKIYVRRYQELQLPDGVGVSWWKEKSSDTDIEYVKKAALVRWAKKNLCASAYIQIVNMLRDL